MRNILFFILILSPFHSQSQFIESGSVADSVEKTIQFFDKGIYLFTICRDEKFIFGKKVIDFKICDSNTVKNYILYLKERDEFRSSLKNMADTSTRSQRRTEKFKEDYDAIKRNEKYYDQFIDSLEKTIEQFSFFCFIDSFRFFYYSPNTLAKQHKFKSDFNLSKNVENGNYQLGYYTTRNDSIFLKMNPSKKDSIRYLGKFNSDKGFVLHYIYYSEPSWVQLKPLIKVFLFEDPIREEYDVRQVFGSFPFTYNLTPLTIDLKIGKKQPISAVRFVLTKDKCIHYLDANNALILKEDLQTRPETW